MKCPKCGTEVEKGNLFCPHCLEEIPWVPEYNTVETILKKKKYNEKKRIQKMKRTRGKKHMTRRRLKKGLLLAFVLVIFTAVCAAKIYTDYKNLNSYAYQYNQAEECCQQAEYEKAIEYIDRAILLDDTHPEARDLLARILVGNLDVDGALKVLESSINDYPDSVDLYRSLVAIYIEQHHPGKVRRLLKHASSDVQKELSEYIAAWPEADYDTGSYSREITVTLSCADEESEIYYTLDGSRANKKNGTLYEGEITMAEGTTELRAIAYNSNGIPSDELYRKYIVAIAGPDAPVIMPEETYFETDTEITIEVPEGCICYYAFDEIPSKNSTTYTAAISMPEGEHTLYAMLVGANGKESEITSRTYTLVY